MKSICCLLGCLLLVAVTSTTAGSHQYQSRISLEDIERDYGTNDKSVTGATFLQLPKSNGPSVQSPTKFGFVPQRTATSYAATKPKYQYSQTNYKVKKTSYKPQQQSSEYSAPAAAQPVQQQPQQYTIQYQQPAEQQQQHQPQYDQYENVQYVSDNSVVGGQADQYYSAQPQYYYVQQQPQQQETYQAPSTAVESVVDPKTTLQYVTLLSNAIPTEPKYQYYQQDEQQDQYQEVQLPPVTTTLRKYTSSAGGAKQQYHPSRTVQYVPAPASRNYYQPQEVIIKREPKSLLDSYVPSYVQLQYLRQQQQQQPHKTSYSKY